MVPADLEMILPKVSDNPLVPTYTVVSRHSDRCPHRSKGRSYVDCDCFKFISIYDPRETDPKLRQPNPIKAKTRIAAEAERLRQALQDRHNPHIVARQEAEAMIRKLQEKTHSHVTIEKAVGMFLQSKRNEGVSPKRIERYLPLLGNVDPNTFEVIRTRRSNEGRLFAWIKTQTPQPKYISDLTPELVEQFRNSWDFPSDNTDYGSFGDLKRFFDYCVSKKWIEHPMQGMKAPRRKKGSRTTAFSDAQYDAILVAIKSRFPKTTDTLKNKQQYEDAHRLLAFVELQRWSGMALSDAVTFKLSSMKDDGRIRYNRRKTGQLARPTVLPHVVQLLKDTVPVDGLFDLPFLDKTVEFDSNTGRWTRELKDIFKAAGIESVELPQGGAYRQERAPHDHMMRDSFAVGQLRTQYALKQVNLKAIADALGDTMKVFLEHYAPFIAELEEAHDAAQQDIVKAQQAVREEKERAANGEKVVNIAEGRK